MNDHKIKEKWFNIHPNYKDVVLAINVIKTSASLDGYSPVKAFVSKETYIELKESYQIVTGMKIHPIECFPSDLVLTRTSEFIPGWGYLSNSNYDKLKENCIKMGIHPNDDYISLPDDIMVFDPKDYTLDEFYKMRKAYDTRTARTA